MSLPAGRRGITDLFKLFLLAVAALRKGGVSTLWKGPEISPANIDFKTFMPLIVAYNSDVKKC